MPRTHHARKLDRKCSCCQNVNPIPDELDELSGSVGEGGANRPDDVTAVQSRLNAVAASDGGPVVPLDVDGLCGPLTKAAVKRFQVRYPGQLLADGRIDPGKNTWKKLVALSEGVDSVRVGLPKAGTAAPAPAAGKTASNADDEKQLNVALYLSRHRIYEAILALDVAAKELLACEAKTWFHVGPKPMPLFQAYQELQPEFKELPTVDRCFHVAGPIMTAAGVKDTLRRLRKVYTDMVDVIVRNTITTPAAEIAGTRRFIRVVSNRVMTRLTGPDNIAVAPEGGWWDKNANVSHILYNALNVYDGDAATTLIHEMSHFVSHHSSYAVGYHHESGLYNGAFNDTHAQAVRNSYCYEWYAFLASFKSQRSKPNAGLVLA